jgi:hypothetical protein
MSRARPFGYFLWGLSWLLITAMVEVFPPVLFYLRLTHQSGAEGPLGGANLFWLIGVPVCAWLFIVFPFVMGSQALMGFVASRLALRREYRDTRIVEFVGGSRSRFMEPRIDNPTLQVLDAIGNVGGIPGWVFAISATVITLGGGLVLSAARPIDALVGTVLAIVGAGGAVVGIRTRVNAELAKARTGATDRYGLTQKQYRGLRYRENKRARDLQKARDAGRAPATGIEPEGTTALDRWAGAEAEHALRAYPMAAYNARMKVPGALDEAFDQVFTAMEGRLTRAQAEQYVIDAAAFRGKKPVPVRATE